MAALDLPNIKEELTCSNCLHYLTKPVAMECGHKFCYECLLRSWKDTWGGGICLICKNIYKLRDPRYNLQLGMMAMIAKHLKPHLIDFKHHYCKKHEENVKRFCVVEQMPLCEICILSKEHESHIIFTIEKTKEIIKEEVKEILNFLHKALASHKRGLPLEKNEQVPSCSSLKYHSKRTNFPKVVLRELSMQQGWLEWMRTFSVDITLDEETSSPYLIVSLDLKSVANTGVKQDLIDHRERFDYPAIMGTQVFTSGMHYWEVIVGEKNEWEIGICKASLVRKNAAFSNKDLYLLKCAWHGKNYVFCNPNSFVLVPLAEATTNEVGVLLDYDLGTMLFYDVPRDCPLLCLPLLSLGPLRPIFFPGSPNIHGKPMPLTISPVRKP
ncbi:E3 ubiquitin-protein ligase TRIM11-like [Tamandua tetradactyla]|uniref:E3 ubiquitin-protein ligase TRIM11-like n=1 Tax=Tamandua tetradactyla TaxID=48850 RepID=UPI00405431FD